MGIREVLSNDLIKSYLSNFFLLKLTHKNWFMERSKQVFRKVIHSVLCFLWFVNDLQKHLNIGKLIIHANDVTVLINASSQPGHGYLGLTHDVINKFQVWYYNK